MNRPFLRSYWVLPGQLIGGFLPSGPDEADCRQKLQALLDAGVTSFVNLMEGSETDHRGHPFLPYAKILAKMTPEGTEPIPVKRFPIPDLGVPSGVKMVKILDHLDAEVATGKCVYVHCWGGKGRTGTVLGCWLARHGEMDPLSRLAELTSHSRSSFPRVPETPVQRTMVQKWREG